MVTLRNMKPEEYPAYCEYFVDDYSREIAENYGHSLDKAIELAKKDLSSSFPNGLATSDHELLCIETEVNRHATVVGYLWHSVNLRESSTFIYDFYVSDLFRGKGIGKQAISAFEQRLKGQGISQIKLRVAYHNKRAYELYQAVGFVVTGYNMSKNLG